MQTASSHLSKMESGGLLRQRKQGRHRYFTLHDDEVGSLLEAMMGPGPQKKGPSSHADGPEGSGPAQGPCPCYNHLAGDLGVRMMGQPCSRKNSSPPRRRGSALTPEGKRFFEDFAIDFEPLEKTAAAPCANPASTGVTGAAILPGPLGSALLTPLLRSRLGPGASRSRALSAFNARGETEFLKTFAL